MSAVVLPVGYQAAREPGAADAPPRLRIRIGTRYVELTGRDDVGLWFLAHGAWSNERSGWSRDDVLTAAAERDIDEPVAIYERLLDGGLLAEASTSEQLRELARRYRLSTLLYCVGNVGDGIALAVADSTTRVRLEADDLAVYRAVPLAPTIADGIDVLAAESTICTLDDLIARVQFLISRGGAYLDKPIRSRGRREPADA